jgi:two-component system nitrogen regulation sensor histidine kinase NtrY
MPDSNDLDLPSKPQEIRKRRRERISIVVIGILFCVLTWVEIRLLATSEDLPFVHSIFFFGLVNFNIVLLLLMLFLIFRNVVKAFVERRGKMFGSSIKGKLIASFVAFSFIPTLLMFLISVGYINSSFDKWFSLKISNVLKNSLEVTNSYYFKAKKDNYHFANLIAAEVDSGSSEQVKEKILSHLQKTYALDSIEFYPSILGERNLVTAPSMQGIDVPRVSVELLEKGIRQKIEASTIHQFKKGNLVRVIVPLPQGAGAIVVSNFVPLTLVSSMDDIASAYAGLKEMNPLEYPVRSIYLVLLILMTLVILFAATWFGFYLARQLSIPLVMLGRATKRISKGEYTPVEIESGSDEIIQLVSSFNSMAEAVDASKKEIQAKSESLQQTLNQLDEHSRYIEVVLKNVTTGVISVDNRGRFTTINKYAADMLGIKAPDYIGKLVTDLITSKDQEAFRELLSMIIREGVESIRKEVRISISGKSLPIQMNLSVLKDERGQELGKVLVFDDMSPIVNAQRAAAWTEVARRIAHEIKNPLTPIRLSAQRLQRKFGSKINDDAFSESIGMIIQQVDDLKNLVNEFSQFARLPEAKRVVGDLNDTIDEAMFLYRSHQKVQILFEKDETLPEFSFDADQIKRVIQNLTDNAIAAVRYMARPKVTVQTQYDSTLRIVRLIISDNGEGIPEGQKQRVFEPYFSTKESGTGLGLPIVKRIVEDHNGYIRALDNPPQGTRMVIEFPVAGVDSRVSTV